MTKHERTRLVLLEITCAFFVFSLAGLGAYTYYMLNVVAPREAHRQCIDFIDEAIAPQAEAECNAVTSSLTEELAACKGSATSTPAQ